MTARKRIVVLGMMAKLPVPGVVWQTLHYLQGLERLGFEPFYVEANARTPSMLMERESDDGSGRAAALIARVMEQYGMGGQWAYHALHENDGRCCTTDLPRHSGNWRRAPRTGTATAPAPTGSTRRRGWLGTCSPISDWTAPRHP